MTPAQVIDLASAGLWYELREWLGPGRHEVPPSLGEMAERFGVSHTSIVRYMKHLEAAGLVSRERYGDGSTRPALILQPEPTATERLRLCLRCNGRKRVNRRLCGSCRQAMRADAVWVRAATRMRKRGMSAMQIYMALSKEGHDVSLYDRPAEEYGRKGKRGVLSVLKDAGMADTAWDDVDTPTLEAQRMRRSRERKRGKEG